MADFDSSLPVRTQNDGDVVARIGDGTTPSQQLAVDANGFIGSRLYDAAGTGITSQVNGAQQALDVGINVAGVQIDPRQIRALTAADVVTAEQGTSPWITQDTADGPVAPGAVAANSLLVGGQFNATPPTVADTEQVALQVDATGKLLVAASISSSDDHNYGVVGANTLRTAAQIGNATGAADFNNGAIGAQTLRVSAQVANATGAADFNFGTIGAQSLRSAAQIGNATGAADFNFGAIGAQSLRSAAQIGNATGAADFNNGATGAQTLRTAANLAVAGANVSAANPVPVSLVSTSPGTAINDYKRAIAIAAGATDNHDYTVTAATTLHLNQIESSGSGKAKMEVQVETGVATGVFTTRFVQFNSTGTPNMHVELLNPIQVAAGVRVRVIMKNSDLVAQDMYSTISGFEV